MTKLEELMAEAHDTLTVKTVFGEPYQSNGVTLIPVAAVRGGVGGGEGEATETTPGGSGGGMGMSARPVGAYQITGDEIVWIPAADVTRVIIMGQIVAIVALLVARSILRRRRTAG
ncbi:MAG: spore germination protein GerW family protein [Actinomycetota bacterium]|nr:spore germination protein GerW family protein [Actinomycetota bacterium]